MSRNIALRQRRRALTLHFACAVASAAWLSGGSALTAQDRLPSEPGGRFGRSITAAFEGWFDRDDGRHVFLVGYYNRNLGAAIDIPVGPENHIEPGGPDLGQPTHFLPGRQVGVFTVVAPQTFTPEQHLTWTITTNGETTAIPLRLNRDYVVSPMRDAAVGNTPPAIRFTSTGAAIIGPVANVSAAISQHAKVGIPVSLPIWVSDDAKYTSGTNAPMRSARAPVTVMWSKYRGPGTVTFAPADGRPILQTTSGGKVGEPYAGDGSVTATFGAAGQYILHLVANDYSGAGGGGEVCCWTTAMLAVAVD